MTNAVFGRYFGATEIYQNPASRSTDDFCSFKSYCTESGTQNNKRILITYTFNDALIYGRSTCVDWKGSENTFIAAGSILSSQLDRFPDFVAVGRAEVADSFSRDVHICGIYNIWSCLWLADTVFDPMGRR